MGISLGTDEHFFLIKNTLFSAGVYIFMIFCAIKNIVPLTFPKESGDFSFFSIRKALTATIIWMAFKSFHTFNRSLSANTFIIIVSALIFYLICLYVLKKNNTRNIFERLLNVIEFLATIVSIYAIFQYFNLDFLYWRDYLGKTRVFSFAGNPNFLAGFLSLCIPFMALRLKKGFCHVLSFGLAAGAFAASFSAAAIFSLFLSVLLGQILFSNIKTSTKIILLIVLGLVISFFLFLFLSNFDFHGFIETKLRMRLFIWANALELSKENFITGTGLGTFGHIMFFRQEHVLLDFIGKHDYQRNFEFAHCDLLQLYFETGLIGFLLFMWLLISVIMKTRASLIYMGKTDKAIIVSLGACFIHSLFSFPMHIPGTWIVAIIFLAHITSFNPFLSENKTSPVSKECLESSSYFLMRLGMILFCTFLVCYLMAMFLSEVYFFRAQRHLSQKNINVSSALSELDSAVYFNSNNSQALGLKARLLMYENDFQECEKLLKYSLCCRGNIKALTDLGTLYFLTRECKRAINIFRYALSRNYIKTLPKIYFNMGQCFSYLNNLSQASEFFNQAIRVNPFSREAHFSLGNVYFKQNKYDQAVLVWTDLLKFYPQDLETLYNMGLLYEKKGALDVAEQFYEKCIELDSDHFSARLNLGVIFYRKKNYRAALKVWRELKILSDKTGRVPQDILNLVKKNITALETAGF